MAKRGRAASANAADGKSLRLRAAWLYHAHGLTQNDVADKLGLGRSTVIRLLEEAMRRGEVKIWIEGGEADLIGLALQLENALGIGEVIVVPGADSFDDAAKSVGLALGKYLSGKITDDSTIGVGWGRSLTASLASFHPPARSGVKVLSLLGGAVDTRFSNPGEFAWKFASALNAECYLFPAPLIVNSAQTRRTLIEECGLHPIFRMAEKIDLAVVSAAGIDHKSGSYVRHLVSGREHAELIKLGSVGDVLCNFIDAKGNTVDHPVNSRIMSVDLESLGKARHVVLATGGRHRAAAILATARRIRCHTLITDEAAARAILGLVQSARA